MTPFLIKIDRISCRVNPRSFLSWIKKKRPMEVENVEIERMRLHMERDGKGEMNCWAALGMDAAAGEAAYADAQKSSDKQEQDLDPEAFEDDGKNEFKGMDKKEKKKAKKSKREKEEAKHAGGVLGMFAVKRVCLRGHRYDIDAFMRKTKTTAKDVQSNIIKMQVSLSVSLCNVASRRLDGVGALRHTIAAPSLITIQRARRSSKSSMVEVRRTRRATTPVSISTT